MKKSVKKQQEKRQALIDELRECICDNCRQPDILDEDALSAACDSCKAMEQLGQLI